MKKTNTNIVMLHGRWPERINGILIADIPLCDSNNEGNWMGWTKKQLEERGYEVVCPNIVNAISAPYEKWKEQLEKIDINEETILVGLSAGGYVLLRYLQESGKKIKKLILVAPGSKLEITEPESLAVMSSNFLKDFYRCEIASELQQKIAKGIVIFISNDRDFLLKSTGLYKELLSPKIVKLENLGHFSFLIPELPELLEEILNA